jgi:hypothetical protein
MTTLLTACIFFSDPGDKENYCVHHSNMRGKVKPTDRTHSGSCCLLTSNKQMKIPSSTYCNRFYLKIKDELLSAYPRRMINPVLRLYWGNNHI